jgi:hypothetical protein
MFFQLNFFNQSTNKTGFIKQRSGKMEVAISAGLLTKGYMQINSRQFRY